MDYAHKIEQQRRRYYGSARSIMRKVLRSYSDSLMEDINKATTTQQMLIVAEKPIRDTQVKQGMDRIYRTTMPFFAEQAVKQLKPKKAAPAPIEMDSWQAYIDSFVKSRLAQRIVWITNTTEEVFKSIVRNIIAGAIQEGLGIDRIARNIRKELNITERYRAERIARTEVVSASNEGSFMGAKSTGLDLDKEWMAYIDDKTRDSHLKMGENNETVGMNELFSNGLEYPGDPSGPAEEVINCRCTIGYVVKDSEIEIGRNL
jgi:SPP1 gp7 family putative phage head morphogenesis protein